MTLTKSRRYAEPWSASSGGGTAIAPGWAQASLASLACFWTSSVLAAPTLHQDCKSLSAEDSARVETRLFASLLARDAPGVSVSIACDDRIATVTASAGAPEERRSVALVGRGFRGVNPGTR